MSDQGLLSAIKPSRQRRQSHRIPHAAIFFSMFIVLTGWAYAGAQTFRGTILGTVTGSSGAIIQDATVRAKNVATGLERITSTDAEGNYTIAELPIGTYDVRIEKRGFSKTFTVSGVVVTVASEKKVDAVLKPAGTEPKSASSTGRAPSGLNPPPIPLAGLFRPKR